MKTHKLTKPSYDDIPIYFKFWEPEKEVKGVIALVHGLGEHCNRYEHWARLFIEKGWAVAAYDRRGHGKSGGKRGHTPTYEAFYNEIEMLLTQVETLYPDKPVFLYGHSMGGNLVLNYMIKENPEVNGAIVTGPFIRSTNPLPKLLLFIARILKSIFPAMAQSNGLDVQQISRDEQVVEDYKNDELVHDRITNVTAVEMIDAAQWLDEYNGAFEKPLLCLHGGSDGITDPKATEEFCKRVKGPVTLKIWDGLYHEIHNEPEKEEVFNHIWEWISNNS